MNREKFDPNFCYRCNTVRDDGHVCRLDGVIPRSPGEARTPGWRTRGLSSKMKFAVTSTPRLDAMRVALDLAKAAHEASPRDEDLKRAWLEADHEHHLAFCAAQGKWEWIDGRSVWVALDAVEHASGPPTSTAAAKGMADRGDALQRASAAAVASVSGSSVYTSPAYMNSWARWVATADDPADPFPPYRSSARGVPVVRSAPAKPAPAIQAEPVQAEPVQAEPVQAEPVQAEPVQAEPVQAEPVQAPAWIDTPGVSRRVAMLARRVVARASRRLLEVG